MKTILSFQRVAFLALALGTASVTATFAQTVNTGTTTPTAPTCSAGGWHHHHHDDSVLTATEKAQLKKAHEAALAANGTLQTEQTNLKQQFETLKGAGSSATQAQWQALHQQKEAFHKDLKAAELLIDPTLAPIFAKLEAAHHHST
jgi:hypothetical protein